MQKFRRVGIATPITKSRSMRIWAVFYAWAREDKLMWLGNVVRDVKSLRRNFYPSIEKSLEENSAKGITTDSDKK